MKTKHLFAILLATGLAGCQDAPLEPALEQAGDNRKELEAVLEHYADEPLKEQAARFLIEHMDAQYAFGGEAVEQYGNCMDSLFRHCNGDRVFWIMKYDTLLQRIGTELSLCQQQKLPDTQTLTAGFLTEQIDSAFTLWQQNWTRQYSFDTFCRYVLPYRVGHERTGNWRRTFVTPVGIRAEYRTAAPTPPTPTASPTTSWAACGRKSTIRRNSCPTCRSRRWPTSSRPPARNMPTCA